MMNSRKIRFLDSDALKLIAIVTMLIDHIGAAILLPAGMMAVNTLNSWIDIYGLSRSIGRTAFPIFVFLLVEGFFHTHSRKKYFGRLLLFALLSEIPFDMAIYGKPVYMESQNVFWTLVIGFLTIWGIENFCGKHRQWLIRGQENRILTNYPIAAYVISVCVVFMGVVTAYYLRVDYRLYGVPLIVLFYFGKRAQVPRLFTCIAGYLLFLWEPYCIFGFLLILFYNGTRKKRGKGLQYFFYLFYPVHLLILGLIRVAFFSG